MISNGDGPRDKPEDYFALLRGLNRLQKWAERNLMKFNNKRTWGNQVEIIVAEKDLSVLWVTMLNMSQNNSLLMCKGSRCSPGWSPELH